MKIKNRIRLGFGFIFAIVLFFGAMSVFFISRLSNSSKVILKNNYETLGFTKEMRSVLDENQLPLNNTALSAFNEQLVKQEHNITEKGESIVTSGLRKAFNVLQSPASSLLLQQKAVHDARAYLRKIEELNMRAIVVKTDAAQSSVNNAVLILGIIGCITFLVLFSFSVNISGIIAGPVIELENGLDEISRNNYDYRLDFTADDEFGKISASFNTMAYQLKNLEHNNLTKALAEKRRMEVVIEQLQDAVIITNEMGEMLFMNNAAHNLLNLAEPDPARKQANNFTKSNPLFKSILESGEGKSIKFEVDAKESALGIESIEVVVPNIAKLNTDVLNIARLAAGKIYLLRDLSVPHKV